MTLGDLKKLIEEIDEIGVSDNTEIQGSLTVKSSKNEYDCELVEFYASKCLGDDPTLTMDVTMEEVV